MFDVNYAVHLPSAQLITQMLKVSALTGFVSVSVKGAAEKPVRITALYPKALNSGFINCYNAVTIRLKEYKPLINKSNRHRFERAT